MKCQKTRWSVRLFATFVLLAGITSGVNAQGICVVFALRDPGAPSYLVPFLFAQRQGAYQSSWSAEAVVYNGNAAGVRLVHDCEVQECARDELAAGETRTLPPVANESVFPGRFYNIEGDPGTDPNAVAFQLRVYDANASARDFGTYVPVPRWDLLKPGRLVFVNVPTDASVRPTLRIFALIPDLPIRISFFDQTSGALLEQKDIALSSDLCSVGYVQVGPADFPANSQRLRIEAQATVFPSSIVLWGLLSLTSADNRQITLFPSTTVPLK